jgi:hypothetical protein
VGLTWITSPALSTSVGTCDAAAAEAAESNGIDFGSSRAVVGKRFNSAVMSEDACGSKYGGVSLHQGC